MLGLWGFAAWGAGCPCRRLDWIVACGASGLLLGSYMSGHSCGLQYRLAPCLHAKPDAQNSKKAKPYVIRKRFEKRWGRD